MSGARIARSSQDGANDRKALGAYYTPPDIVGFLCEWAIRSPIDHVLEPSAGNGAFVGGVISRLHALGAVNPSSAVHAIELREEEARAIRLVAPQSDVRVSDFFEVGPEDIPPVQVVVGNPPFVRFQRFTGRPRDLGRERAIAQEVTLSGLASSWAHFVVHSCAFLEPQSGRLGLVLPSELLHADYAQPVRDFLLRRFGSVTIVAFDKRAFHPTLVDAVLLLCDREGPRGLHVWRLTDAAQLSVSNLAGSGSSVVVRPRWSDVLHRDAARLYGNLIEQDRYQRLGSVASVGIGLVTGANNYFIISEETRIQLGLPLTVTTPIVERGRHLGGLIVSTNETRLLFDLARTPTLSAMPHVAAYLAAGRQSGVDRGYKTSRRKPWWAVPKPRESPNLLLGYMHSGSPRLFANPKGFWSTNLVHGVRTLGSIKPAALAAASLSAATAFSSEVEGRVYGGGVLKLEPSEAERLLVPRLASTEEIELASQAEQLDQLVRSGEREEASRIVDAILDIPHEECAAATKAFQERRRSLAKRSEGD